MILIPCNFTMTTTNRYHHLHGLLPSKPPPWRHRHRPHHLLYLLPILTHLLPFCTVHHAHPTPLQTTPPVNTTPMSRSHSLSTRSQPNPGLQPHNKTYPLQLPPPFLPPHYPTIPSHQNDLLPTTTSSTHGTHHHPHR